MTSGEFTSFPTSAIFVDRAKRQRRELNGIEELADSIDRIGLINPLVIERSGELRAGERRFTAVKEILGWTHVSVQFVDELSEHELQLLELEENLRRENLTWVDECNAVARYHELRQADTPDWSENQTADMLGFSQQKVSDRLSVAREIAAGNQRVIEAPRFSIARNVVQRTKERQAQSAIKEALQSVASEAPEVPQVPILNADFHVWAAEYTGEPFNMIHCDVPYGVNADKHHQGQAKSQGGYADSPEIYRELVDLIAPKPRSIDDAVIRPHFIAESAHMIFWFSMDYYEWTKMRLDNAGWTVLAHPLIWFKNDNTGILPDPQRGPRRLYETAFFCYRGGRKLTARGAAGNIVAWPGQDKSIHMSEKPRGMLRHFMSMVVDEHSRVLDPTCGSGNALKVATELRAPTVLGLELNKEFYERAVASYFDTPEE